MDSFLSHGGGGGGIAFGGHRAPEPAPHPETAPAPAAPAAEAPARKAPARRKKEG